MKIPFTKKLKFPTKCKRTKENKGNKSAIILSKTLHKPVDLGKSFSLYPRNRKENLALTMHRKALKSFLGLLLNLSPSCLRSYFISRFHTILKDIRNV